MSGDRGFATPARQSRPPIIHGHAIRLAVSSALLLVAVGVAGCGKTSSEGRVVARVGASVVTSGALTQQMATTAPEGFVPDAPTYRACVARQAALALGGASAVLEQECRQQYQSLLRRALNRLISLEWLIEEARDRQLIGAGAAAAEPTVRVDASAGRALQAQSSSAAAALRRRLFTAEAKITHSQIAQYYRRHLRRFERDERRYVDIDERFQSAAAARRAMSSGRLNNLARIGYHESLGRWSAAHTPPARRALVNAILAAKPGVLAGPVRLYGRYCVFMVTRIVPAAREPLAKAAPVIAAQLAASQRRMTVARFTRAMKRTWVARTNCLPGYVTELCRQYRGARREIGALV
jgi:hypothetical protein